MGSPQWVNDLLDRTTLRYNAKILSEKLNFQLAPTGASLSGYYAGNMVRISLNSFGRNGCQVEFDVTLKLAYAFDLLVKERFALFRWLRRSTPIHRQTGYSMVTERFTIEGTPQFIADHLLHSPDFCYALILFSPSVVVIKQDNLHCKRLVWQLTYIQEIELILERVSQFTKEVERVIAGTPMTT